MPPSGPTTTTRDMFDAIAALTKNVDRVTLNVEALARDVAGVATRQASLETRLPDDYLSQREALSLQGRNRDEHSTFDKRLIALEEWRLAETKAAAERQMSLSNQIQASVLAAIKDDATTRGQMNDKISDQRTQLDARTITLVYSTLSLILGALVYYVLAHIHP